MKKNKKNYLEYFVIVLLILIVFLFVRNYQSTSNTGIQIRQVTKNNCMADDCLLVNDLEYPVGTLPDEVKIALDKAINDEYAAYSTYDAVIKKLGAVRPFSMIISAEEQHIARLKSIYDKYGIKVPTNKLIGTINSPSTIQEACQTGVEAEIANANLYKNELVPASQDYEDVTLVFTDLMNASLQKHLPAFERCN